MSLRLFGKFLFGQQPLRKVIPDVDSLLANPAVALATQERRIGGPRLFSLVILTTVLLPFSLSWRSETIDPVSLALATAGGFLLGLAIAWLVRSRRQRLILRPEGVEFGYRNAVTFCPWSLFNVPGQPVVPSPDRLVLPIAPAGLPYVQQYQDETCVGYGAAVRSAAVRFQGDQEVMLTCSYEVFPDELGAFLLHLGRILGKKLPATPAPPEPPPELRKIAPARTRRDKGGWITVSLARVVFPPVCCACGKATPYRYEFEGHTRWWLLERLAHTGQYVTITLPVCDPCQAAIKQSLRRWKIRGVLLATTIFLGLGLPLLPFPDDLGRMAFLVTGLIFGPLIGLSLGSYFGKRRFLPAQVARYSPGKRTVALRFRRQEYAEQVLSPASPMAQ